MDLLTGAPAPSGKVNGSGSVYLINHNTDNTLATLRWSLNNVKMSVAEVPFEAGGRKYGAGSFIIRTDGNPSSVRSDLNGQRLFLACRWQP